MNICLPYTAYVNDVFRCLFHDVGLVFTQAPVPGKYTKQIGETFANGTLCEGLAQVLGSLCECAYLGADTAVLFAPCGACSEQRMKQKLANCLEENGFSMELVCFGAYGDGNRLWFKWLKENTDCSLLEMWDSKRLFYECIQRLEQFLRLKNASLQNESAKKYVCAAENEMHQTDSLLRLKALLSVFNKRLKTVCDTRVLSHRERREEPYTTGDYFNLARTGSFFGFFEKPSVSVFGVTDVAGIAPESSCRWQKANYLT